MIDLAISGEITLSIKIPEKYSPYLMSVVAPKMSRMFGSIMHTKEALKDISMLPKESAASHLNLSTADCEVLKISNLEQSFFESVISEHNSSHSEHEVFNHDFDDICVVKLDSTNQWLEKQQTYEYLNKEAEIVNNFSSENRKDSSTVFTLYSQESI
jgi:hypothetical protein